MKQALREMQKDQMDESEDTSSTKLSHRDAIQIIDAFEVPKFKYNTERKVFEQVNTEAKSPLIFGDGKDRADVFRERYNVLRQRMLRNDKFNPLRTDSVPVSPRTLHANIVVDTN